MSFLTSSLFKRSPASQFDVVIGGVSIPIDTTTLYIDKYNNRITASASSNSQRDSVDYAMTSKNIDDINLLQKLQFLELKAIAPPKTIGFLSSLTNLEMYHCPCKKLPETIGNLGQLTHLQIEDCDIITLPETIGNLTNLKSLYIVNNKLKSLPNSLCNLIGIKELVINEAGLSFDDIPTCFQQYNYDKFFIGLANDIQIDSLSQYRDMLEHKYFNPGEKFASYDIKNIKNYKNDAVDDSFEMSKKGGRRRRRRRNRTHRRKRTSTRRRSSRRT